MISTHIIVCLQLVLMKFIGHYISYIGCYRIMLNLISCFQLLHKIAEENKENGHANTHIHNTWTKNDRSNSDAVHARQKNKPETLT